MTLVDLVFPDRRRALAEHRCIKPPTGCGQPIRGFDDPHSAEEYARTAMCSACQQLVFAPVRTVVEASFWRGIVVALLILLSVMLSLFCVLIYGGGCGRIESWLTTPDRIEMRDLTPPPPSPHDPAESGDSAAVRLL